MFKVIETKEEFFAAAKAGVLWGNRGCPDEAPQWDHLLYWGDFRNKVLREMWDDAANNNSNYEEWMTRDFAVLVEDDDDNGD